MQLINLENGSVLAEHITVANRFWPRFKGLMFTKSLPEGRGLFIEPCQSIHTFFMRYAIDVIYLDSHNEIIAIHKDIPPGKIGKLVRGAKSVVELPAGVTGKTGTKSGHKLIMNV